METMTAAVPGLAAHGSLKKHYGACVRVNRRAYDRVVRI